MNIGIIGSGHIGGTVGRLWAQAGHNVLFSYSHDPRKLQQLAESVGPRARAGTPVEAARFGDIILFAVPWAMVVDALEAAGSLAGKILLDTTNPHGPGSPGLRFDGTTTGTEAIARYVPDTSVFKAYNTLQAGRLSSPPPKAGRLVLFYCGDNTTAKSQVAGLIRDSGLEPIDTGPLRNAHYQEPNGPLYNRPMSLEEAQALVATLDLKHLQAGG